MSNFASQSKRKTGKQKMDAMGLSSPDKKRLNLPQSVSEQMGNSFQADFSNVNYYENDSLSDMGFRAMARGSEVHFAKGEFNPATPQGQGLIGHELSHVVSQARGEIAAPQGKHDSLVQNQALESRADKEAYQAVKGEQIYSTPTVIAPMSVGASPSMPMQGKSTAGANKKIGQYNDELADLRGREQMYMEEMRDEGKDYTFANRDAPLLDEPLMNMVFSTTDSKGRDVDRALYTGEKTYEEFMIDNKYKPDKPRDVASYRKLYNIKNNVVPDLAVPMGVGHTLSRGLRTDALMHFSKQSDKKDIANRNMNFMKTYLNAIKKQIPKDVFSKKYATI